MVRYLSGDASTEPVSVKIYNTARGAPTPALNALATLLLLTAFTAVTIGFLVFRRHDPRRHTTTDRGIGAFAGEAYSSLNLRERACLRGDMPVTGCILRTLAAHERCVPHVWTNWGLDG